MKASAGGGQIGNVAFEAAREMTKADSYAASLVELAKAETGLDIVDGDLRLVCSTLSEHMQLKKALADDSVTLGQKQKVIVEVFGDKISPVTLNFFQFLVGMGQVDLLPAVADKFAARLEAVENKLIAEVTTAVELDEAVAGRVAERLSKLAGREVTIRSKVDPSIVGGIIVRMGGKLLDGSLKNQLERLRQKMQTDMRSGK